MKGTDQSVLLWRKGVDVLAKFVRNLLLIGQSELSVLWWHPYGEVWLYVLIFSCQQTILQHLFSKP